MRWTKLNLTCICFLKKNKLSHRCFKSSPSICSSWIDHVDFFFIFFASKIRVSSTGSIAPLPLSGDASPLTDVTMSPSHVTLPSHGVKMSSLPLIHLRATLCPISSPLKPKPKHWICTAAASHSPRTAQLPPSITINKNVLSTLATLPTTQSHLRFACSLARAWRHRSSTRHHHSFSPSSHAHHHFAQWHQWWQNSQPSFTFWTTYLLVNSRKKIF
jgi:hypothetical protein